MLVAKSHEGPRELRTLVIVDYISQMVSTAVMSLAHTHRIVREVDIAVVAWKQEVSRRGLCRFARNGQGAYRRLRFELARAVGCSVAGQEVDLHLGILKEVTRSPPFR